MPHAHHYRKATKVCTRITYAYTNEIDAPIVSL